MTKRQKELKEYTDSLFTDIIHNSVFEEIEDDYEYEQVIMTLIARLARSATNF